VLAKNERFGFERVSDVKVNSKVTGIQMYSPDRTPIQKHSPFTPLSIFPSFALLGFVSAELICRLPDTEGRFEEI